MLGGVGAKGLRNNEKDLSVEILFFLEELDCLGESVGEDGFWVDGVSLSAGKSLVPFVDHILLTVPSYI